MHGGAAPPLHLCITVGMDTSLAPLAHISLGGAYHHHAGSRTPVSKWRKQDAGCGGGRVHSQRVEWRGSS
eukprot:1141946-Pelagomonas_calceolata.AAC.2